MINHFGYSKLVGMKTIACLVEDDSIDTVYVCYWEYLNDDYFKMIMETPGGDSFLTRRE